jgi:hypothetical protein
MDQKRIHLRAQRGVVAARLGHERDSVVTGAVQRLTEDLFDPPPSRIIHQSLRPASGADRGRRSPRRCRPAPSRETIS